MDLNTTSNLDDSMMMWNTGTLYKSGIWGFYSVTNYVGVILCSILMGSTAIFPDKTSLDILIFGLCSGCWWMSATCGSQCLASWIYNIFYGGKWACTLEAFSHISAILTQFIFVALIALRSYLLVVHNYLVSKNQAIVTVIVVWVVCIGGTWGMSEIREDDLYLMSAGTYCFFGFSTPPIAEWLIPGLILSLGTMIFCYVQIVKTAQQSTRAVQQTMRHVVGNVAGNDSFPANNAATRCLTKPYNMHIAVEEISQSTLLTRVRNPPSPQLSPDHHGIAIRTNTVTVDQTHIRKTAISASWFILILLIGWFWAAVATIYEFVAGFTPEWIVTAVGVHGVLHSVAVPLRYAYVNRYHKETMWIILTLGRYQRTTILSHSSTTTHTVTRAEKSSPVHTTGPQIQTHSRIENSRNNDDSTPKSARGTKLVHLPPPRIQLSTTTTLSPPSLPNSVSSNVNACTTVLNSPPPVNAKILV